jgi:hypothetical protein
MKGMSALGPVVSNPPPRLATGVTSPASDDGGAAPDAHAPLPQRRRHDDALAGILEAHGNRQEQPQPGVGGGGKPRSDGQPLGDPVDGQRAHDGVAAPGILVGLIVAVIVKVMAVVARAVPEVPVVAARVAVGDQPVHQRRQGRPRREAEDHRPQPPGDQARGVADADQGLAQQPERGRRQHQPRAEAEDAVVHPPRQRAHEQERQGPESRGQTRGGRGDQGGAHGPTVLHYPIS